MNGRKDLLRRRLRARGLAGAGSDLKPSHSATRAQGQAQYRGALGSDFRWNLRVHERDALRVDQNVLEQYPGETLEQIWLVSTDVAGERPTTEIVNANRKIATNTRMYGFNAILHAARV